MTSRLGELTPLPADYLYPNDKASQEIYEKLSPTDRLNDNVGGKWWSMYDLMRFFHSGFMPESGDSNFIRYEIDLTAPELKHAASTDPSLKTMVDNNMMIGLQKLSSDASAKVASIKQAATQQMLQASSVGVLAARGQIGGKKSKRKWGGVGEIPPAQDPTAELTELLKPENLEKECLNDVFQILFNSRNRIFITDSKPGNLGLVSTLNIPPQPPLTGPPAPVGGRRKTRKYKMGKKSGKTLRYRRKH